MFNVLITSEEFGHQLDLGHWSNLKKTLEANHCNAIVNENKHAMRDMDIIEVNKRWPLHGIIVYSSSDQINSTVFDACSQLKVISRHGVGLENVNLDAAKAGCVQVKNTADAQSQETVADLAFGLMLSLARRIPQNNMSLKHGDWDRPIAADVWGKTLGLVGLGKIGKAVARRAKGFSMQVMAYDPYCSPEYMREEGVLPVALKDLLVEADFVSLHCGLSAETADLIGEKELSQMKPDSYLINAARSGLVDQKALIRFLEENKIAGAAIDVYDKEPPGNDPLLEAGLDNLVLTAHIGSYTAESIRRMDTVVVNNIVSVLRSI